MFRSVVIFDFVEMRRKNSNAFAHHKETPSASHKGINRSRVLVNDGSGLKERVVGNVHFNLVDDAKFAKESSNILFSNPKWNISNIKRALSDGFVDCDSEEKISSEIDNELYLN